MDDNARKAFTLILVMMGLMNGLIAIGIIFGVTLSGEPLTSTGGKIGAGLFVLGALMGLGAHAIAPKKQGQGQ